MIHHVSIPARDPQHVATVLAELMGGYAGPFIGPIPGAFVVYQEDHVGSGIEVYPDTTTVVPGNELEAQVVRREPPQSLAFHALVSVKVDRATIERIGAREGWTTKHFWRGPNEKVKLFELYEMWVENRVLFELVTEDMLAAYVKIANGPAQRELLAARQRAQSGI